MLYRRLREHGESIERASNLELADFFCRYLVVDDLWIPLGEALLIETFSPLWNRVLDGFGNHDPGKGRYNQQRSLWDTVGNGLNSFSLSPRPRQTSAGWWRHSSRFADEHELLPTSPQGYGSAPPSPAGSVCLPPRPNRCSPNRSTAPRPYMRAKSGAAAKPNRFCTPPAVNS